jgi:exopolysaccharide production protein ExoQ
LKRGTAPVLAAHTRLPHGAADKLWRGLRGNYGEQQVALQRVQVVFAIVGCFIFGTNVLDILAGNHDPEGAPAAGGRLWLQLTFMAVYAVAGLFLLLQPRALSGVGVIIIALAVFPFVSMLWSINPAETMRRGIAFLGTCVFGVFLGGCFKGTEFVRLLAITYALIGVASLAIIAAAPGIGIHSDPAWAGAWRGLYLHKNALGGVAAFGSIILLLGICTNRGALRILFLLGLGCMMILLANAMSTTGYVVFALLFSIFLWAAFAQLSPQTALAFAVFAIAVLSVVLLEFFAGDPVISWEFLGKSSDMSGRVPLWMLSTESISRAPYLGYGYQAFWSVDTSDVNRIAHVLHYRPYYSHNGFVEALLGGGVMLFIIYLIAHLSIILRGVLLIFIDRIELSSSFPLIFGIYYFFANLTESKMLAYNDLIWALFIAVLVVLGRRLKLRL